MNLNETAFYAWWDFSPVDNFIQFRDILQQRFVFVISIDTLYMCIRIEAQKQLSILYSLPPPVYYIKRWVFYVYDGFANGL